MEGSATSLTITALLCLGLCRGQLKQTQTGTLRKPSIWASPGPIITMGSSVSILCQGSLQAKGYFLKKDGVTQYSYKWIAQNSMKTVSFSIKYMDVNNTGKFHCLYISDSGWSELSDPLLLVMTGAYSKPSLLALPSPLVASGGNISLLCSSNDTTDAFHLLKEGGAHHPPNRKSQFSAGRHQATFPVGPVSTFHGGTYRCYGSSSSSPNVWSHPSDPLDLKITGSYSKPSLSVHPSPLATLGSNVSLVCGSTDTMDTFHLLQEGGAHSAQHRKSHFFAGSHQVTFTVDPVNTSHGGAYRCYGSSSTSPHVWSHPSDSLHLKVTGAYEKPFLRAHPGHSVTSGESVTLQCLSDDFFDTFHLFKGGFIAPPQDSHWKKNTGPLQANFTMSPVTSAHEGTYRCYSSHSTSPYLWSHPSGPLELVVTGGPDDQHHTSGESDLWSGHKESIHVLIGVLVAFILLLFLLLYVFIRRQRQRQSKEKQRQQHSAVTNEQPEAEMELANRQSPEDENPQTIVYAQVDHCSRSRQDVVISPSSLSGEFQGMKDRKMEDGSQRDRQVAAPEDPQEAMYANLNNWTLGWETTPSIAQSGASSVYAAVVIQEPSRRLRP